MDDEPFGFLALHRSFRSPWGCETLLQHVERVAEKTKRASALPRVLIVPLNFNFPPPLRFSRLSSPVSKDEKSPVPQLAECSLSYAQERLSKLGDHSTSTWKVQYVLHAYSGNLAVFVLRDKSEAQSLEDEGAKPKDSFACYRRVGIREDSMMFPIAFVRDWFFASGANDMLGKARGNVSALVEAGMGVGGGGGAGKSGGGRGGGVRTQAEVRAQGVEYVLEV